MKKFSKESMQQFMLMHAEKLILGVCLAATGFFVWTSLGGEQKAAQTPSDLKDKADRAKIYVNRDAWAGPSGLKQHRQGKSDAKEQIEKTVAVDGSKFRLDFGGSPAEALALRKDPAIVAPERLDAQRFHGGVMMVSSGRVSSLKKFNDAPKNLGSGNRGSSTKGGGSSTKGSGSSTRGSGSDFDDSESDFGDSGSGSRLGADNELLEGFVPLNRGSEFGPVNALTSTGLLPTGLADSTLVRVVDGVCVTALVDYKKQSVAFENAFAESIAYNANRDRPVYQFLQVQRREVAEQGDPSEWEDISENVTYNFARGNPLPRMPFHVFGSAPEVASPSNFDPVLTQAIPAFAQFDYQKLALHPELKMRREYPAWKPPKQARELDSEEDWGQEDQDDVDDSRGEDGINALRKGTATESYREAIVNRKPGGQYRLVRFFDLKASRKKSFEYRVRVWLGDPNQLDPSDGFVKNRGQKLQAADGGNDRNDKDQGVRFAGSGDGAQGIGDMTSADNREDGGDKPEVVVDVRPTMLAPNARRRIAGGTSFDAMQAQFEKAAKRLAELKKEGRRPPPAEDEFEPFHVVEYSAAGDLEQVELPPSPSRYAYMQYLRYARPSAWSESVRVKKEKPTADVMAGTTIRGKRPAVQVSGRSVEFDEVEPSIAVVVSSWDRDFQARLPTERVAHIGETMNFNDQAYVTDPITWQIKVPEVSEVEGIRKYTLPFKTNVTIVDAFFGDQLPLPDKRLVMESATEVLTMDANGNLKVSNQFAAARNYRNELALPDDSRFYGRPRRTKKPKEDEAEDFSEDY